MRAQTVEFGVAKGCVRCRSHGADRVQARIGALVCALGGSQIGHGSSAHAAGAIVGALIGDRVRVLSDGYTTRVTR